MRTLLVFCCVWLALGCKSRESLSDPGPSERALAIAEGITLSEFQDTLRKGTTMRGGGKDANQYRPPRHHFTVRNGTREMMLVTADIDFARFSFVFEDRRLAKILDPIGGTPEAMLQSALEASGLTDEEYRARLQEARLSHEYGERHKEPFFLLYLFPKGSQESDYRKYVELMHRFDASAVLLDADRAAVDELLGRPTGVRGNGRSVVLVYGENAEIGWYRPPEVSIQFTDDHVSTVITRFLQSEYEARNR